MTNKPWKKFDENNLPKHDKFLAVISGYKKPMVKIVHMINLGNIVYSLGDGSRMYPERILWWTEIPEFNGEYK